MNIDFSKFTESLSIALDYAEKAFLNVEPYHGMRVAILTNKMAKALGFDEETVYSLTQAAMLHDCALSEYLIDELPNQGLATKEMDMSAHCVAGESILKKLPFYSRVNGSVLYHHERADGKGALKQTPDKTPIFAQLIHIADAIDVEFNLYTFNKAKYDKICEWLKENEGVIFTEECAEVFITSIGYRTFDTITGDNSKTMVSELLPKRTIDISTETLKEMSSIFADITDYKSHFTWKHSMGIAEKADKMGRYYRLTDEDCDKLFIAGALHDIGKLIISDKILEKPGKLSSEEFKEIQNHAVGTWDMLHNISGLEDITLWASLHHEKLDGSGYPFGYKGERLDKNSRLMACLDIYQALIEDRPYKTGMSHKDAMNILRKMGDAGQLDETIINDIDSCFGKKQNKTSEPTSTVRKNTTSGVVYRCPVCGYIYEGKLPEDFICPQCEQPASIFEKLNN